MKRGKRWLALWVCFALLSPMLPFAAQEAKAATSIYVSPNGSDSTGNGSLSNPYKTIAKARDAVRTQIAGGMTSDVTVYLRGGTYAIESPIQFHEADSGRNGYKVIYTNYPGEQPVISGGQAITGWQLHSGNVYKATVGTSWSFNVLFENDVRSVPARHPNEDYHRTAGRDANSPSSKFIFAPGDLPAIANQNDLVVNIWPGGPSGHWNWFNQLATVQSVDYVSRTVTLDQNAAFELGRGSRYYMTGAIELLDQPGEWYLDKTAGVVYYYPRTAPIANQEIIAPKTHTLVEFKGSSTSSPVQHIEMSGLVFKHSDADAAMADEAFRSGIHLENAKYITIKNSLIEHIGGNGIKLYNFAQNNTIYGNRIRETGHTGVVLKYGGPATSQYWNYTNTVSNNEIYRTGRAIHGAMGIDLYESGNNTISHNLIYDAPGTAINIKGLASIKDRSSRGTIDGIAVDLNNYKNFTAARNNRIEFNDVTSKFRETQDDGFIHTYWTGPGNTFHNNFFHDSTVHYSFGQGIYIDDESENTTLTNNVLFDLRSGGGKMDSAIFAKSQGLTIRNNIIAGNTAVRSADISLVHNIVDHSAAASLETKHATVENNISYMSSNQAYWTDAWSEELFKKADGNVFYNSVQKYLTTGEIPVPDLAEWKSQYSKYDQYTVTTDPLFAQPSEHDYRLRSNSPALARGFQQIDFAGVGLKEDFPFSDQNDPLARVFVLAGSEQTAVRLSTNGTAALTVKARSVKGYPLDLSGASITYSSSNTSVATVSSSGVVTAVGTGNATINVQVVEGGVTKSTVFYVHVNDAFNQLQFLTGTKTIYAVGQTFALKVAALSTNGNYLPLPTVTYSSSNSSVASVNSSGVLTATGTGTAVITAQATIGGVTKSATVNVQVQGAILDKITATMADATLGLSQQGQIDVAGTLTDNSALNLNSSAESYTSLNTGVATVSSSGLVTPVAPGNTKIKVDVTLNGVVKTRWVNVGVLSNVSGVSLSSPWQLTAYKNDANAPESHALSTNGEIHLKSAGEVIWDTYDDFTYVWQPLTGAERASITATISRLTARNGAALAGLAFRAADAQQTDNVTLRVHARGETALSTLVGTSEGYATGIAGIPLNDQDVTVKLEKDGTDVTGYYLENGQWYPFAVVHDMPLPDNLLVGLVLTSEIEGDLAEAIFKNVSVTVGGEKGTLAREYWTGFGGSTISSIPLTTTPTGSLALANFEGPTNIGEHYGARIRGYIHPPATGSYTFRIASDDHSELWLSTDANPSNKVKIAGVTGWTTPKDWTKYSSQQSSAIALTAGQKYYVEVLHKENAGGDNVAVGWTGPGISTITVIGGEHLSPYTGASSTPAPDTQAPSAPTNVSVTSKTDTTVNLSWTASSDNVGVTGYDVYVGGNKANTSPISGTTYTVTGLTEQSSYSITVKAKDAANNESAASSALSVTTNGGGGTGNIVREYWGGVSGGAVSDIPLTTTPTSTSTLTSLEGPRNVADSYGARVRGYLHPASTGSYTFYIASDDASKLWLSTDANPANKVKLAEVTAWTIVEEWNKYSSQQSTTVSLTAGQTYYVEVLHKEGAGNDHFSVGWIRPGRSTIDVITGSYLSPYVSNMLANGSFESNSLSGWANWGNSQVVNTNASQGTYAVRVGTGAGGIAQEIHSGFSAGNTVRLEASAFADSSASLVEVAVKFKNSSNQDVTSGATLSFNATSYQTKNVDVTVPSGTAYIQVYVWKGTNSGYAYVDNLKLTKQ
ncbi:PA14 domain-containing protein [Paenibacillus sp.]|uniref:PA14 domain-containing protein n=1 Tax=Paenibacillus sp. TaxID=58172 RepID=UPI002D75CEAA|nr:PA14 domain-containing protein [Paenibacillus sp.]HZG56690.1 PA14 domain-containing protein [Paenibacillus sp.]